MGFGNQFNQVFVSLFIFDKQNQMISFMVDIGSLLAHAFKGHVHFASDNRFNIALFGFFIELNRPVKHSVICKGARIHAQFFYEVQKSVNF